MRPIEEAAQERFANNTIEELRDYAKELGVEDKLKSDMPGDKIRRVLLETLGLSTQITTPAATAGPRISRKGEDIFPPYNLTPNGIFGGRRHRIKLPRPEGTKLARAEGFGWNGKNTYWIPYDEVACIPEPIFNILTTNKRRRAIQKRETAHDGAVEVTTAWEFDDLPFSYLGVDPATAHLCGSLMEWYRNKGPSWFEQRELRELRMIAARCELSLRHPGKEGKEMEKDDALAVVKTFFFSHPDAIEEAA